MRLRPVWFVLAILVLISGSATVFAQLNDKDRVAAAEPAELIEIIKRHVWPDTDFVTRMAAQKRIVSFARSAPDSVVPLLIRELKTLERHDKATVQQRIALIETLRDIGPAAEAASTVLIEILQDESEPNEWIGMAAQMALDRIGSAAGQKAIADNSKSRASTFASTASDEEIRQLAEQTAFLIRQELRKSRPSENVLTAGLDNLTASGRRAAIALPTLVRAYVDARLSASTKARLAQSMSALGMSAAQLADEAAKPPADFDPFDDLLADVAHRDSLINSLAMAELGRLGPSQRAIDALIAALNESRSPSAAANALGEFGEAAARAVPHLIPHLADVQVGANAIQAAGRIGVREDGLVRELRRILRSPSDAQRGMAASALGNLGASEALPDLQTALKDSRKYTRILAANAIARFAEDAAPAVADLARLAEDPDDDVRRAAVEALGAIGAAARPAATAVARALDSDDDRLRRAAEQTIEKIGGPVAEETQSARADAHSASDVIAARNLIAGGKLDELGRMLNKLPAVRMAALAQSLSDHQDLDVAYVANASRVMRDGDSGAIRRVVEIALRHEKGDQLMQGLAWSIIHGAGTADAEVVMAKLVEELQTQLQSAPPEVRQRFRKVMPPDGAGGN